MAIVSSCQSFIFDIIDKNKNAVKIISDKIWSHPEKSWEEKYAHDVLTEYLSSEDFEVEKNYVSPTGFRATFENHPKPKPKEGAGDSADKIVSVCFLCQYDALPEVGHAAGHNLVSAIGVMAALSIKAIIMDKKIYGKVYRIVHTNSNTNTTVTVTD